jgi:hypothetical protein
MRRTSTRRYLIPLGWLPSLEEFLQDTPDLFTKLLSESCSLMVLYVCISVIKVVSISVVGFGAAHFSSFQLQSTPTELIFSFMFLSLSLSLSLLFLVHRNMHSFSERNLMADEKHWYIHWWPQKLEIHMWVTLGLCLMKHKEHSQLCSYGFM